MRNEDDSNLIHRYQRIVVCCIQQLDYTSWCKRNVTGMKQVENCQKVTTENRKIIESLADRQFSENAVKTRFVDVGGNLKAL
jgi:hypothetical protein